MSTIRIAVIGADQLDPEHHLALNTLAESGAISAFALDANTDDAGFDALKAAMHANGLDAVIIAGPRSDLAAWLSFCLQNGWPVYSTHPIPPRVEDMIDIRRVEQMAPSACLQFGLTARLHDSVTAALTKAESGDYGQLLTLRAVCGVAGNESEGAVIFEHGAQMIDLMQAFAGPFQDIIGFADFERGQEPGSETNVLATLRTHSGAMASLHLSATQWRPTFRLELGFEDGYLWLEGLNTHNAYFGQEALIYARTGDDGARHETVDRFDQSNGTLVSVQSFLSRIADPSLPAIGTSQQAFDTLNTLQRILAADPIYAQFEERHAS